MDNILYIGENIKSPSSGMQYVNWRNIELLKTIYSKNFHIYSIKGKGTISTLISSFRGNLAGVNNLTSKDIIKIIDENNITNIFLSSSRLGKLAASIKKHRPNIKVITFFHNIEKEYSKEEFRVNPSIKNWYLKHVISYNEKLILKNSDYNIVLNERDNNCLYKIYNKTADLILPITFYDNYNENLRKESRVESKELRLLFVGSAFFANIEGVNWFIDKVLPYLQNCKFTIVGKGMDKYYESNDKMRVLGFVDDLAKYYYNADIIISPIFSGSGMKTKTAEALMYGCPIIGTKEAFEGYNISYNKIGGCFQNDKEMIQIISNFQKSKEMLEEKGLYAREVFMKEFSMEKSITLYSNWLKK